VGNSIGGPVGLEVGVTGLTVGLLVGSGVFGMGVGLLVGSG
jgi:hypothetical protein